MRHLSLCLPRRRPIHQGGATRPDSAPLEDYDQLARGLVALLAGCTPAGIRREFPVTQLAARALQVQLRKGLDTRLPAGILNDLSHEIAIYADAATRAAAQRCFRRAVA